MPAYQKMALFSTMSPKTKKPTKSTARPRAPPASMDTMYLEIHRISNLLAESKNETKMLKEENRTLQRVQRLQDKAIRQMSNQSSDMPRLIESLYEELRVAKAQIKNGQEKMANQEKSLREIHGEYVKQRELNDRCHAILRAKNIEDNDILIDRIHALEDTVMEKEELIAELRYQVEELKFTLKHRRKDENEEEPRPRKAQPPPRRRKVTITTKISNAASKQQSSPTKKAPGQFVKIDPQDVPHIERRSRQNSRTISPVFGGHQTPSIASSFPSYAPSPVPTSIPSADALKSKSDFEQSTTTTPEPVLQTVNEEIPKSNGVQNLPQKSVFKPLLKQDALGELGTRADTSGEVQTSNEPSSILKPNLKASTSAGEADSSRVTPTKGLFGGKKR